MSSSDEVDDVAFLDLDLTVFAFGLFTAQPTNMRGESGT